MVFSSALFLFLFLPVFLTVYYACPVRGRNWMALAGSLTFYAWGAPAFVLALVGSALFGYFASRRIFEAEEQVHGKAWFVASLAVDVGLLLYFKYANFFVAELNQALATCGVETVAWTGVALPIGISFFTFQKISYIADVYQRRTEPAQTAADCLLYVALFPQLIAGPIVRYHDVAEQIRARTHSGELFLSGVHRFCVGLGKKILIADTMAAVVDPVFAMPVEALPTSYAWLGGACYALQIYFDFSGYSDMAIGLGRMVGFKFRENFNKPYTAVSMTDFWRRWHISLSSWMREYLYVPLGGNRVRPARRYANLWIVFLISGFWHGAAWSFVVWGAYHGLLLTAERLFPRSLIERWPMLLRRLQVLVLVLMGWIIFRAESLGHGLAMLSRMFIIGPSPLETEVLLNVPITHRFLVTFLVGAALAVLPCSDIVRWLTARVRRPEELLDSLRLGATWLLLVMSVLAMVSASHSPFIYFRF
jgi:alginate O-acetyltransferase complex protein AlgI